MPWSDRWAEKAGMFMSFINSASISTLCVSPFEPCTLVKVMGPLVRTAAQPAGRTLSATEVGTTQDRGEAVAGLVRHNKAAPRTAVAHVRRMFISHSGWRDGYRNQVATRLVGKGMQLLGCTSAVIL